MGFVRSRGDRHQALYTDPNGKRRSAGTFTSKQLARQAIRKAEGSVDGGSWTDPKEGRLTFRQYVEGTWLPNRVVRANTRATDASYLRCHLMPTFGDVPLKRITPTSVQGWVAHALDAGVSARSVAKHHTLLRTILKRAMIDQKIPHNPAAYTELPVVPASRTMRIVTPPQVDLLLELLTGRHRVLVMLLIESGLRWGEAQALRVSHLDLMRRLITVEQSVAEVSSKTTGKRFVFGPTKTNRARTIKVSEECALALAAHIQRAGLAGDALLFATSTGEPTSRSNFRAQVWLPATKKAQLVGLRVHDLRHSHASWLLAGGADLKVVMDRMGHTQITTTQGYLHTMPDADDVALDALARIRQTASGRTAGVAPTLRSSLSS